MRSKISTTLLTRLLLLIAGTGLGIALLIFLFRSVNLNQLGTDFSTVNYSYLAIAVVPFLFTLLAKVPRWALLFGEDAPNWDTLFGAMNVGYAVNALLPARLGEIVRAYWVRDRSGVSMMHTLATIALERVIDGITLLIVLLIMATTVALPLKLLGPALTIGVLFVIALVLMVWLAHGSSREGHVFSRMMQRWESGRWALVAGVVRQIVAGVQVLRSRRAIVLVLTYTFVTWASNAVLIWLVLRAFHIEAPLAAGILLTAVLNLGMAVPSAPGYLGVFDYLMVLTLSLYGIHHTPALAAALAFHAIAFVPVTIIGLFYITRSGFQMTLKLLRTSTNVAEDRAAILGE